MYTQQANPWDEVKKFFRNRNVLSNLIIANVAVWLLVMAVKVVFYLLDQHVDQAAVNWVLDHFALPAAPALLLAHPWTLLTYMFLHVEFFHILFNMLWLFWFGRIFLQYLSNRQLLWVYLLGGIAGGLVYFLSYNIFPVFQRILPVSVALGASASVMAIVTAISFYVPNYSIYLLFFGRVKIIYLAIILFVIDFFMIPLGNAGGHLAHIGGALFGYGYFLFIRNKYHFPRMERVSGFFRNIFKPGKRKTQGFAGQSRPVSDEDYNFQKNQKQKRIDEILDKIAKGGYESLSREEKEFLFRSSNRGN